MAQIKIYGLREHLEPLRARMSDARRPNEIEITITETRRHNWGFRGQAGDEPGLPYKVEV